jgi:hypothetical protein
VSSVEPLPNIFRRTQPDLEGRDAILDALVVDGGNRLRVLLRRVSSDQRLESSDHAVLDG